MEENEDKDESSYIDEIENQFESDSEDDFENASEISSYVYKSYGDFTDMKITLKIQRNREKINRKYYKRENGERSNKNDS